MPMIFDIWSGAAAKIGIEPEQSIALVALVTILVVFVTTKLTSAYSASHPGDNGSKSPPVSSHWIPFIGNTPLMIAARESFLTGLHDRYGGAFSFLMMGKMHHFFVKPSLVSSFFTLQKGEKVDQTFRTRILTHTLGMKIPDFVAYDKLLDDLRVQYRHLLTEPGLGEMTSMTVRFIKQEIASLVTFNHYPADQTAWERCAGADVIEDADGKGNQAVEVDFMELIRNFVAQTASQAIFGTDFMENFPEVFKMNWIFDEAFVLLAAGIPGWVPVPRLQRGKFARRKVFESMYEFSEAVDKYLAGQDPGPQWQDLENVGRLVMGRAEIYRKNNTPFDQRASLDALLLWTLTANSNPLTMWMLYEIYRDPVLLEQIREEIAPYVKAVQPENEFGPSVWVSPELETLDLEGLVTKCPILKAAYIETMRLYISVWALKWVQDDIVIGDRGKGGESYLLKKGSCAHAPLELHNFDPKYFPDPREFRVDRHIRETENESGQKVLTAELGTLRPFSGGAKMCKGRNFALREMLVYAAAIITFYDIEPPKGGPWPVPELVTNVATRYPKKPMRVWIKKRVIPTAKET